jgi:2-polyprenyl-3-methyl-5-hydroxy-6-metoxy-1,4-benzoquinol methylase
VFPLLIDPGECPLCGNPDQLQPLDVYPNPAPRRVLDLRFLALYGCATCGLVFTHPRPGDAQLEAYYGSAEGWDAKKGDSEEASAEHAAARMARALASKRERRERELALMRDELGGAGAGRRVLDFGCGIGGFLDALAADGWETWGIEPGPSQREVAGRSHRMIDSPPTEPTFDLVIVNHVLEHLRDPLPVMTSLAAATNPGGWVFISTPDFGRLGQHGHLHYVRNELHLCSWTVASVESLLRLSGFGLAEHFQSPEWSALGPEESRRLKVLGERTGSPRPPAGAPLEAALSAMREYAAAADEFEQSELRRAAEAKQRKRERRQKAGAGKTAGPGRGLLRRVRDLTRG